jgi:hypothetical protein
MTLIPHCQYALNVNTWQMKNKTQFIPTLKGECCE